MGQLKAKNVKKTEQSTTIKMSKNGYLIMSID